MITIATKNDFKSILALYKQLWEKWDMFDEAKLKEIFENDLNTKRKEYLIAKVEDEGLGVCSVRINHDWHYILTATIDELIVHKDHRGKGIGKQLIKKAFEYAKTKNCYRIELHSNIRRTEAHDFYKGLGFDKSSYFFKKKL
ncbi:GNAT family N-acetyltransferase [Candidatus Dojkabacteria bacterium]|uniref:GNAT family N-acetyltransferase n=1 Tax=Candidatus Dojkabacteria bacterium TaxID=2099670 RepID=A0A955L080_9BACT|nr:GNAT family N-acetyltransferase [Candidatus Dojkabacteria bacterium]